MADARATKNWTRTKPTNIYTYILVVCRAHSGERASPASYSYLRYTEVIFYKFNLLHQFQSSYVFLSKKSNIQTNNLQIICRLTYFELQSKSQGKLVAIDYELALPSKTKLRIHSLVKGCMSQKQKIIPGAHNLPPLKLRI